MDRFSKSFQAGDAPVIFYGKEKIQATCLIVDFGATHNDQAHTSTGPCAVKVDKLVANLAIGRVVKVHCGHDDSVGNRHGAYGYGFEQSLKHFNLLVQFSLYGALADLSEALCRVMSVAG